MLTMEEAAPTPEEVEPVTVESPVFDDDFDFDDEDNDFDVEDEDDDFDDEDE